MNIFLLIAAVLFILLAFGIEAFLSLSVLALGLFFLTLGLAWDWRLPFGNTR